MSHQYVFRNITDYSEYRQHDGKPCTVLDWLTKNVDPEVGIMFRVRTSEGDVLNAFADELVPTSPRQGGEA